MSTYSSTHGFYVVKVLLAFNALFIESFLHRCFSRRIFTLETTAAIA